MDAQPLQEIIEFTNSGISGYLFSMPDNAACGPKENILFASCETWIDCIELYDREIYEKIVDNIVKTIFNATQIYKTENTAGRPPIVAMLSYRTSKERDNLNGAPYENIVEHAFNVAQKRYPDIQFSGNGSLQLDAALIPEIYESKVNSKIFSDTYPPNIFIFPTKTSLETIMGIVRFAREHGKQGDETEGVANEYLKNLERIVRTKDARIVMPEASNPVVLKAVEKFLNNKLGSVVLLGKKEKIISIAKAKILDIQGAEVIDPEDCLFDSRGGIRKEALNTYDTFYCKAQGRDKTRSNMKTARSVLSMCFRNKNVRDLFFGTAMVAKGDEARCLAAGKEYNSKDIFLAAKMLIGTKENVRTISGDYLMCHPKVGKDGKVFVSDMASEVCPDADQLADIAINTAQDIRFYIGPQNAKVAFIFEKNKKIEKMRLAIKKTKEALDGNGIVDGPMGINEALEGGYTGIVLPDLSTSNLVYKAFQRISGFKGLAIVSGGANKPVFDISRGADSDEIYASMILACCGV